MSAAPFPLVRLRTGRIHAIAVIDAQQTFCGLAFWRRYDDWEYVSGRAVTCKSCRRSLNTRWGWTEMRARAAATFALRDEEA